MPFVARFCGAGCVFFGLLALVSGQLAEVEETAGQSAGLERLSQVEQRRQAERQGQVLRQGQHFAVRCDLGGELGARLAGQALTLAEQVSQVCEPFYGLDSNEEGAGELGGTNKRLYQLHLFENADAYRTVDQALTGGNFQGNLAFSSYGTRAAYIAVQPPRSKKWLERLGLPSLTLHQIAHEAAHVVCYNRTKNYQHYPLWFAEGAAQWLGVKAMQAAGLLQDPDQDPYLAKGRLLVQDLARMGRLPGLSELLSDSLSAYTSQERYALWLAFFEFLTEAEQEPAFLRVWMRAMKLPANRQLSKSLIAIVEDEYDLGQNRGKLQALFLKHVLSWGPVWDERMRSFAAHLGAEGESTWCHGSFDSEEAVVWSREAYPDGFRVKGTVEFASEVSSSGEIPSFTLLLGEPVGSEAGTEGNPGHLFVRMNRAGHVLVGRSPVASPELQQGRASEEVLGRIRVPTNSAEDVGKLKIEVWVMPDCCLCLLLDGRSGSFNGRVELDQPVLASRFGLQVDAGTEVVWSKLKVVAE